MALRAVLFDLDGVLVDSEGAGMAIARGVTRAVGLTIQESELAEFVGVSDSEFYKSLARQYPGFDGEAALVQHEGEYWKVLDSLPEVAGAVSLVRECARQGLKLAVVTGSTRNEASRILQRLGIHELFSTIVAADDVRIGKPDSEGYRLAVRQLGIQEAQALAIEDSDFGVAAAQGAHVTIVGLRRPGPVPQQLTEADLIVEELTQLSVVSMRELLSVGELPSSAGVADQAELQALGQSLRGLVELRDTVGDDPWLWLATAEIENPRRRFVRGDEVRSEFLERWLGRPVMGALATRRLLVRTGVGWALRGCCVAPLGIPLLLFERPTKQESLGWRSTHVYLDTSSVRYVRAVESAVGLWEGLSVLEVGCGTGLLLARAGLGNARRLVGVDLDNRSVETARVNLSVAGIGSARIIGSDMFDRLDSTNDVFDVVAFHPPYRIVPADLDYPNPVQRVGVGRFGLDLVHRFIEAVGPHLGDGGRAYVYLQTPEGRGLSALDELCLRAAAINLRLIESLPASPESVETVARGIGEKLPGAAETAIRRTLEYYHALGIAHFANRLLVIER